MTKAPTPQKCQKGKVTTQKTPQKSSIKQRLRNLGWSFGVTTATQLVWLTWFTGSPSHSPQQPCNQKDIHLKEVPYNTCESVFSSFSNNCIKVIKS